MRPGTAIALALALVCVGCRTAAVTAPAGNEAASPPPRAADAPRASRAEAIPAPVVAPAPSIPDDRRVLVIEGGTAEHWIDVATAEAEGYTVVDFTDDWTPFIFAEQHTPAGELLPNRYRRVLMGLANDRLDEDGAPLPAGQKNYLELYGIFPSLSVLRARFVEDGARTCHDVAGAAVIAAAETISYVSPAGMRADDARIARLRRELEDARHHAHAKTLAEFVERDPRWAPKLKLVEKRAAEKVAMTEVERRLGCEGFLHAPGRGRAKTEAVHQTGVYDDPMRLAVRQFQQKHMIYESNYLRRGTMTALGRPLLANDHASFLRALRERVVSAADIVEDGSAGGNIKNLADEYTTLAAEQLGLATVEGTVAFFHRHPATDFAHLRVAVKLPPRPSYHSAQMDLSIVIDRGDVWYDLPFDDTGAPRPQPRKKYPQLSLYMRDGHGQQIPLCRWRTTVGGWRADQAPDGYEYYRYKGSDVGPRVIRQVVAGPVWVAPESTPLRTLVKTKQVGTHPERVVNYDELGPGFMSAYGLIAGYFVTPGVNGRPDFDNGIRAHGSSEYLSMYSANGFSHGCHRLPNHLAIRLYSFILRHRQMRVVGDQATDIARQFLRDDDVFEIRIPSRGYAYVMDPPLPVNVLEGEIEGVAKEPILGYVPKPGVHYPGPPPPLEDSPEVRAGGVPGAKTEPEERP